MTDAHAKAVEAAADVYEKTANEVAYLLRHDPSEIRGWATEATITAYLAAMRAEGWVMARDCGEEPEAGHYGPLNAGYACGWNTCRAAMLKGAGDGQG